MSVSASAESGDQVIEGTWVHTVIDHERGEATFSNSCGSQTLTQQELQDGAIPGDIIPCPRTGGPNASCGQVRADWDHQMHKPMSAAWARARLCMPGFQCEATCSDFDEYERVLDENREIERKWVLQCNGTLTLGNGNVIDRDSIDAHYDKLYEDFLEKKRQVCDAERSAASTRSHEAVDRCLEGVASAGKLLPGGGAASQGKLRLLRKLQRTARNACAGTDDPPASFKLLDATLTKEIAAAERQIAAQGAGKPSAKRATPSAEGASCGDAGGHMRDGACWVLGMTHSGCDDLHGRIVDSAGYQYCAYDPATVAQSNSAGGPRSGAKPGDLRERLRKSLSAGGATATDTPDDETQGTPKTSAPPEPPTAPTPQPAKKTMTAEKERKACKALGPKWRYDPTATYNFAPNAPAKCFPVFTDSLDGEPGFEKQ